MSQPVHSVLFDQSDLYNQDAAGGAGESYATQPAMPSQFGAENLQFYQTSYSQHTHSSGGAYASGPVNNKYYGTPATGAYGQPAVQLSFWSAFGTGNIPGEPPLLEELGVNFDHIKEKSFAVLNPLRRVDRHIMDDTDLMGPIIFCLLFGIFLLLSAKPYFGYIYGAAVLGCLASYAILNLMSEAGIDIYRTASVLGYSILPLVALSGIGVMLQLNNWIGYIMGSISVLWCTYAASGIFVTVLDMSQQRWLVAYPLGLLYSLFALITVF